MSALFRPPRSPHTASHEEAEETTAIESVALISVLALVVPLIAFVEAF